MTNSELILASSSPRRRDFLNKMGVSFTIMKPDTDETVLVGEEPYEYVMRMAHEKAMAIAEFHPDDVVLAADTVVVIGDVILGKPTDREDAKRILRLLSGRTHEVLTAVSVVCEREQKVRELMVNTRVTFAPLTEELIDTYVASGECDDKSGAYAVQGVGSMFIEKVEGSVSSVVGLPICQVRQILAEFGIQPHPVDASKWA